MIAQYCCHVLSHKKYIRKDMAIFRRRCYKENYVDVKICGKTYSLLKEDTLENTKDRDCFPSETCSPVFDIYSIVDLQSTLLYKTYV